MPTYLGTYLVVLELSKPDRREPGAGMSFSGINQMKVESFFFLTPWCWLKEKYKISLEGVLAP